MALKLSYYLTMTHKFSKTWKARLDSTRLLFTIFIQNIATQLGLESSDSDNFFIGFYTNNSQSGEFLMNSKARLSYLPKFDCLGFVCYSIYKPPLYRICLILEMTQRAFHQRCKTINNYLKSNYIQDHFFQKGLMAWNGHKAPPH